MDDKASPISDIKKLSSPENHYRLRLGDYRIIYTNFLISEIGEALSSIFSSLDLMRLLYRVSILENCLSAVFDQTIFIRPSTVVAVKRRTTTTYLHEEDTEYDYSVHQG